MCFLKFKASDIVALLLLAASVYGLLWLLVEVAIPGELKARTEQARAYAEMFQPKDTTEFFYRQGDR